MHYTKNIKERPLVRSKECLLAKVVIANICMNSIAERMGAGEQGEVCWRGKRTSLLEKWGIDMWDFFPWLWYTEQELEV